jgi:FixJ family two-component response regulator
LRVWLNRLGLGGFIMQANISHVTATEIALSAAHLSSAARSTKATFSDVMPLVFVIDDEVSVRESLELLLAAEGWQVETFASSAEFMSRPRATVPCCLVLDVRLQGHSGLELQRQLAGRTDIPIVFITGYADIPTTVRAMKAGAYDVLTKPLKTDVLVAAVHQALEQSHAALLDDAEMLGLRTCYASLTPREREVMALVVSGLLNKEVGRELGITEITVKAHRGQVMRKMQADSLAALVGMATHLGMRSAATHR